MNVSNGEAVKGPVEHEEEDDYSLFVPIASPGSHPSPDPIARLSRSPISSSVQEAMYFQMED